MLQELLGERQGLLVDVGLGIVELRPDGAAQPRERPVLPEHGLPVLPLGERRRVGEVRESLHQLPQGGARPLAVQDAREVHEAGAHGLEAHRLDDDLHRRRLLDDLAVGEHNERALQERFEHVDLRGEHVPVEHHDVVLRVELVGDEALQVVRDQAVHPHAGLVATHGVDERQGAVVDPVVGQVAPHDVLPAEGPRIPPGGLLLQAGGDRPRLAGAWAPRDEDALIHGHQLVQ